MFKPVSNGHNQKAELKIIHRKDIIVQPYVFKERQSQCLWFSPFVSIGHFVLGSTKNCEDQRGCA